MRATLIIGDSRAMNEVKNGAVDLIVTSPPYWQIKDYGTVGQTGYNQTLHEYFRDLYCVWAECYRVLKPGRRLCINIGDQFARSIVYGRYKIIPLHSECIAQCERIGFDYMGSVIWQKKTTMNPTGGATVMGSFPYPPNGMIEIDYEFILIFKKPGKGEKMPADIKEKSKLSKEEWKKYFSGHWSFGGAKQLEHQAMFPEELPKRLIKMFSFYGETVLDPFLGSGTTMKAALTLNRHAIGYEINESFLPVIREKAGFSGERLMPAHTLTTIRQSMPKEDTSAEMTYTPGIQDAKRKFGSKGLDLNKGREYLRVVSLEGSDILVLENGLKVRLLGVKTDPEKREALGQYLCKYVCKKKIYLQYDQKTLDSNSEGIVSAYVYLSNRLCLNLSVLKAKLVHVDPSVDHPLKERFRRLAENARTKDG